MITMIDDYLGQSELNRQESVQTLIHPMIEGLESNFDEYFAEWSTLTNLPEFKNAVWLALVKNLVLSHSFRASLIEIEKYILERQKENE